MLIRSAVPIDAKLETLASAADFDVCGYSGLHRPAPRRPDDVHRFIHRAALPGGGSVCLFKVLLTNICVNDCAYCVNRVGRDCPRSSFQPDELARVFMQLHQKKLAQGLFLTSGIAGDPSKTMTAMIDTVEILRRRFEFKGYVHLKILPGAGFDCVEQACRLANRVSVNIEAPTARHLAALSSKKDIYHGIIERMRWVKQITARDERLAPGGQTTQFVVGAAGETDRDILHTTEALYSEIKLRRIYYSAFRPVGDSRLAGISAASPWRQHRLYQTDWLLRIYGFSPGEVELALDNAGGLPLKKDPKLTIAGNQPWLFPVDINKAGYDELLRVPGIGPISAQRIVDARRDHSIDSLQQLKKMRVVTRRAAPYIWFRGMTGEERQLSLFREPQLEPADMTPPSLAEVLS